MGAALPLDPNDRLQRIQRLAIKLEVANFGSEAIVVLANEKISETEPIDVRAQEVEQRNARRVEAERATQLILEIEGKQQGGAGHLESEEPLSPEAQLIEEIANLLVEVTQGWSRSSSGNDLQARGEANHLSASPDIAEDDGLEDGESIMLPETMPEKKVLEEALKLMRAFLQRDDLTATEQLQVILLFGRHIPVFRHVLRPPEQLLTAAARLRVDPNAKPEFTRQYPMAQSKLQEARRIIEELVRQGVVEAASSDWNSPMVLVPKKDGTWRFAIDYRRINKMTSMDPAPIPHAKLSLHALGGNVFFSCMDLLSSFWQQPLHPDDRPMTAFSMPGVGQLQWTVLPMGMRNSSQTQQRAMEMLIRGLDPEKVMCYIDDLIVATHDLGSHLMWLDLLFRRLEAAGLALKLSKCELVRRSVTYLGHVVSAAGIQKDSRIVEKIRSFPSPRNVVEVRAFLGMVSFYRDFIPGFTELAIPLTDVVSTKKEWRWEQEQQRAFEALREAMAGPQLLAFPDWDKKFLLATDASDRAIGGVLSQEDEDGVVRPIMFLSRKLSPAESRYGTTEKEALAVVTCVSKCRHYLFGRRFLLITDHSALQYILGDKATSSVTGTGELRHGAKLTRWALLLGTYQFDVQHVPGKRLCVADYLSRYAEAPEEEWSAEATRWFAQ